MIHASTTAARENHLDLDAHQHHRTKITTMRLFQLLLPFCTSIAPGGAAFMGRKGSHSPPPFYRTNNGQGPHYPFPSSHQNGSPNSAPALFPSIHHPDGSITNDFLVIVRPEEKEEEERPDNPFGDATVVLSVVNAVLLAVLIASSTASTTTSGGVAAGSSITTRQDINIVQDKRMPIAATTTTTTTTPIDDPSWGIDGSAGFFFF